MKRIILLSILLITFSISKAQIGGLSASKLNTLSATTVELHKIEFEPSIAVERDLRFVPGMVSTRDTALERSFNFRFTYGASKRMEAGFSVPVDVSSSSFGLKYIMLSTKKLILSGIAGANFDLDSKVSLSSFGAGLVLTDQYTDNFSSDYELVYLRNLQAPAKSGIFFNMGHGIYFGSWQYVIGINSIIIPGNARESQVWLTPGVTIEPAEHFLMVITYSHSLLKTDLRSQGLSFALTITLD